mmetsp:Transcript_19420/g.29191  ORF Transcript_19420/g.29191 Transcript_19420/m.29191 type:complete len:176 (+) Transcript_19420:77-604(+)
MQFFFCLAVLLLWYSNYVNADLYLRSKRRLQGRGGGGNPTGYGGGKDGSRPITGSGSVGFAFGGGTGGGFGNRGGDRGGETSPRGFAFVFFGGEPDKGKSGSAPAYGGSLRGESPPDHSGAEPDKGSSRRGIGLFGSPAALSGGSGNNAGGIGNAFGRPSPEDDVTDPPVTSPPV